jgi:cobalt-zinc-cadmium efflux system outer membrane protein
LCAAQATGAEQLTLNDAIGIATKNNPSITAARQETNAADAHARGARALTNPELLVAPTIIGTAGADSAALLAQPLEVNGSRRARARIAAGEAAATRASAAATERDIVRDVKLAYWDVALAQSSVDLSRYNVQLAESLNNAAKRQVEVGTSPGSQAIKTELELTRARQDLVRSEAELSRARAALNSLLSRDPATDFVLADKLCYAPVSIDATRARDIAFANRPELRESAATLEARRAEVAAARAARIPDVAVTARKETFGGDGGVALAFTLPILDWGSSRAEQRRAQASSSAEVQRSVAIRNAIALEVQDAVVRVQESDRLVKDYEQGVLTQSQQLADIAQKGYKAGATSYLEVLEANRTLRDVRASYNAALAEMWKAKAELEWASASDLATLKESGK